MNKLNAAIVVAGCLFFFGLSASAQAISLKVDKVPVKQAIQSLKKSTGYSFVYETGDLDTKKIVSVDARDLEVAVKQILQGQNVVYEIQGNNIIVSKAGSAAKKTGTVSGVVKDAKGEAVVGAGIFVKGTTEGTVSDLEGKFKLEGVDTGSTLEVSCIGFQKQEVVWNGVPVELALVEDSELLNEVVVVGYGTMRKSDLTGSIARADLTVAKTAPNSNILQAIQGSMPGVNIGQTNTAGEEPAIEVRGQITINGNTDPLVVVDGVIYNGRFGDISPNDIEAIDVLKDASSKAVYGAKAANGVILVTTKSGRREDAPKISYSSNWSWSNPTKNFVPLNSEQWMKKNRDVDYKNAYTAESGYTQINPNWSYTSTGMNSILAEGVEKGVNYDWWSNAMQTGHLHTNTLNVTGGSKNVSYFISGGYTDQAGIVKNDTYTRATLRANFDVQIRPWLKVGTNSFLAFLDYSGVSPTMETIVRMPTVASPYNDDGSWRANPQGSNLLNPFLKMQSRNSNKRHQINSTAYALIEIPWVKGLTYRLNYNFTKSVVNHNNFNEFDAGLKGEATKENSTLDYWLLDNIVNYSNVFGKHSVNATFVYGANKTTYDYTKALGQGYANSALGYNDLKQATTQKIDSEAYSESSVYQMLRGAYNYDGRYFVTATLRRDGYSGFAENHKTALFPSVGLGWTISNESWMKKATFLDNLKIRASYGVTGNQTSRYKSLARVESSDGYVFGDGGSTAPATYIASMANSNLKWETTAEINAGIDFAFFGNRLGGSIDYYNATTTDLLWNVAIPSMTGFTGVNSNVGKLKNNGVELLINAVPVKTNGFDWTVNLSFSANKNRIVSLLGEDANNDGKEDDLVSSGLFIGESISAIYGYEVEGIWQLEDEKNGVIPTGFYPGTYKIKDQNGDGKITPAEDRVILGNKDPLFRMGIRNTFNYKGFNLSFFFNIIQGGKNNYLAYNEKANYCGNSPGNATNQNFLDAYDYWSPSNPNAKFAAAWLSPSVDTDIVQSRSFVRLQDLSFGYTFHGKWMQKAKIHNLRLYVSGKNLLTFTNWDGWDPEVALGVCSTAYPVMRTFAFGVDLSF